LRPLPLPLPLFGGDVLPMAKSKVVSTVLDNKKLNNDFESRNRNMII